MASLMLDLPQLESMTHEPLSSKIKLFSGRANHPLAEEIATYLGTSLSPVDIKNFADGETYVRIQESVRGADVFVIQPTCGPVNNNLMELLIMMDALKRASANTITAVIPYFGYARQDRKTVGREAISAKLVANLIASAGADRVVAMDLHTGQLQGFFNILTDHLYMTPVALSYFGRQKAANPNEEWVIVSPDAGGVERARVYAKKLDAPIAIIDKRRSAHNQAEVYHIIGDVKGKRALLIDDMIDTAGTMCAGANLIMNEGAKSVSACAAHAVFSGPAVQRIQDSAFSEVVVSNSIPLSAEAEACPKIVQVSIAPLMGEAIRRIHDDESVSQMFE
ncbi:MAG: ribose-phosphate pyrophosphokinase [Vampirovibrionales bacterium]